jgi:hypothetical protein
MKLVPIHPPGRSTRKARAFGPQIRELRAQGYTFEAIREALAAAGVDVSNTTVQREAARYAERTAAPIVTTIPASRPAAPSTPPRAVDPTTAPHGVSTHAGPCSGKAIADAFMRDRITNPLVRAKESR